MTKERIDQLTESFGDCYATDLIRSFAEGNAAAGDADILFRVAILDQGMLQHEAEELYYWAQDKLS